MRDDSEVLPGNGWGLALFCASVWHHFQRFLGPALSPLAVGLEFNA